MKITLLILLSGLALVIPACTTYEDHDHDHGHAATSTTSTTETSTVRTPIGGASTSTTVRSY